VRFRQPRAATEHYRTRRTRAVLASVRKTWRPTRSAGSRQMVATARARVRGWSDGPMTRSWRIETCRISIMKQHRISMRKNRRMRTSCLSAASWGPAPQAPPGVPNFKMAQNNYVTTPLPLAELLHRKGSHRRRMPGPRQNYSIEREQRYERSRSRLATRSGRRRYH